MEMDAQRRRKGITEVKNENSKLVLQPEMKISSDFLKDFFREGASWEVRLSIIILFLRYNLNGFRLLLLKFRDEFSKEGVSRQKKIIINLSFLAI